MDTIVLTSTKQVSNRPDIVIHDEKRKEITLIEVGITSQDQLQIVESEKMCMFYVLAKKMGAVRGCATRIIPYILNWDGIVTNFQKNYSVQIGLSIESAVYIQYAVLKKTLLQKT